MSVNDYIMEQTLLDVTVTAIAPGSTVKSPTTGSYSNAGSSLQITNNTISSTSLPRTVVAEALHVYCVPPMDANGSFPDFQFWFEVDDQSMEQYAIFDGSADGLMAPLPNVVSGGPVDRDGMYVGGFTLGKSTRKVLSDMVNGKATKNMPLEITGYKITDKIRVVCMSTAGFGQSGSPLVPARIIVTGEILDEALIPNFMAGFNGYVYKQNLQRSVEGKPPLTFTHLGIATFNNWNTLPGGTKQSQTRVHRFARFALNNQATGTQAAYPMTNLPELKGADTNIIDSNHDLGFNTAKSGSAFILRGFGCRPGTNQAYIGWQIDGNLLPNPNGFPISSGVNPFNFGSVQPQRPESNLYNVIPRYRGELLVYGEQAVPFIMANGTAIPANSARVAIDGVLVEKVS